ncbi:hypothetical protein BDP27DRAFT_1174106, partial [Rhodocollybia butyracea]
LLYDGCYQACRSCRQCITHGKFNSVPLTSYANGCWIGDVPKELSCLSYAKELVIAHAHTTKCWVKLNAANSSGAKAQQAASGNVCIHPHEITNLAATLLCPISSLYDEIIVMFVANDQATTLEVFKCTPFLVRRSRILAAPKRLKEHNRLYHDIVIDYDTLAHYPDED